MGQLVVLLTTPLLSRIYSPDDYATLAMYTSLLLMVSLLGTFNVEMGIPAAKTEEDAWRAYSASWVLLGVSTVVLLGVTLVGGSPILRWLDMEAMLPYQWLVPVGFFLVGVLSIWTHWAYRRRDFGSIARLKVTRPLTQVALSLALGLASIRPLGLILARMIGQGGGLLSLARMRPKAEGDGATSSILLPWDQLKATLWAHRRFMTFTTVRRYLGDLTSALPVLLLTALYAPGLVGAYGFTIGVIQAPLNVVSDAIAGVYFSDAARLKDKDPAYLRRRARHLLLVLGAGAVVVCLALLLLGEPVFSLIFGERWSYAGSISAAVALGVCSRFVFKPVSNILDLLEAQAAALVLAVLRIGLICVTILGVSLFQWGPEAAIWALGGAMMVGYALQFLLADHLLGQRAASSGSSQE
ncbi:lipopolysaccharide biosynthesis protein [Tessaracoccus caeni]|uniref:lipopolysaccharide biosynthesis protein n=1 Tax=Tessaracoccus caeni TaxID=3031239 RepID=UPI0023D9E283|nr:oligosaccharide flippase family protein [Tessaracoccus caeni]MDF1487355.1 oligosaccharide flippase family protein [Tessaracoccus caeni]